MWQRIEILFLDKENSAITHDDFETNPIESLIEGKAPDVKKLVNLNIKENELNL